MTGIRSFSTSAANGSAGWTIARAGLLALATAWPHDGAVGRLAWAPPRIGPAPLPASLRLLAWPSAAGFSRAWPSPAN